MAVKIQGPVSHLSNLSSMSRTTPRHETSDDIGIVDMPKVIV